MYIGPWVLHITHTNNKAKGKLVASGLAYENMLIMAKGLQSSVIVN